MTAIFLTAFLGILAAQIAPGPNLLAVASVALSQGRQPAVCVAAGVATGVLIWVTSFALGVSVLFDTYPIAGRVLQLLGGCYFIWVAAKALYSARTETASLIRASQHSLTRFDAYKRGLIVVMTNPKAAMMWAAVTAFLIGSGLSTDWILLIAPIGSMSSLLVYSCYGWLFSTSVANRFYLKFSRNLEVFFGLCFGAIGAKLLFDSFQRVELR